MTRAQKSAELIEAMRDAYASTQCVCRKPKERRKSFCRRCYTAIPREQRYGLNSPDTATMALQFRECVGWLEDNMYIGSGSVQTLFGKVRTGIPVPAKLKRPTPRKPVNKIVELDGGREKCLGEEWDKRREECHDRARGRCERKIVSETVNQDGKLIYFEKRCNNPAPLHETETDEGYVIRPGHAHHLTKRKVRDDRLINLLWVDWRCHLRLEGPEKVVPKKSSPEAAHV